MGQLGSQLYWHSYWHAVLAISFTLSFNLPSVLLSSNSSQYHKEMAMALAKTHA